ncbi:MAG: hypothetical protein AAFZ46_09180, partial [Pseudomonadota bacterium]
MAKAKRICSVDRCGKPHDSSGYCSTHYYRFKRYGDPLVTKNKKNQGKTCKVPGCSKPARSRGYCAMHASRLDRHNDLGAERKIGKREAWIIAHANHQGDDCLLWPFALQENGYGVFSKYGKTIGAHRAMCQAAHGPQPDEGYEVAHSCGNP